MNNTVTGIHKHSFLEYLLCYVIWLIVAGTTIWLILQAQINMMLPLRLSGIDARMITFINDASLILVGVIALVVIILLEHYLRVGVDKGQFWPRVARAITIEAIMMGVVYIGAPVLLKIVVSV